MDDFKKRLMSGTGLTPVGPTLRVTAAASTATVATSRAYRSLPTRPPSLSLSLAGAPLGSLERGLVISVPVKFTAPNSLEMTTSLDEQELRFSLLFFDRLDFPSNNLFLFGNGPEVDFLISVGALTRSQVIVSGSGDMAEVFLESHLKTYSGLEGRDPGRWSLARGEASLTFQEKDRQSDRGLIVDLFAAIPVPDKAVPLTDILEFKEKRRAELVALRHHLDEISVVSQR